jgi:hypothetical protein
MVVDMSEIGKLDRHHRMLKGNAFSVRITVE